MLRFPDDFFFQFFFTFNAKQENVIRLANIPAEIFLLNFYGIAFLIIGKPEINYKPH